MLSRRKLLQAMGLTAAASSLPGLAFASGAGDARFVLVVLRGAVERLVGSSRRGGGERP